MRWLFRSVTGLALLASLVSACGSTSSDRLIFRFIRWDNTGITQPDSVGEGSADIDVVQDVCTAGTMGGPPTFEPFSNTIINAVFRNEQASDIRFDGYTTEISDKRLAQANVTNGELTATIPGGRCSTVDRACGSDDDCVVSGTAGTCTHSETTVSGIVLVDLLAKVGVIQPVAELHPDILGRSLTITVTFFGSDANQSFETAATYTVVFADFDNCSTSTGGGA